MNADVAIEGSFSGYQRDRVFYKPDESARFFEAGWLFGLDDDHDGRCVLPVDIDGDGDLDLALSTLQGLRFYENRGAPARFARLRLVATSDQSGGLGAIVRLTADGLTRSDHAKLIDGFQTQVPSDIHFGLGEAARVESVRVLWPSGVEQEWGELPVDRLLILTEGQPHADVEQIPRWPEAARARHSAFWPDDSDSEQVRVVSWLAPDLDSPPEIAQMSSRFEEVAWTLVVPEGFGGPEPPESFEVQRASPELLEQVFGVDAAPVLPSTFVFIGGELRRSFHRALEVGELEPLLESLRDEQPIAELLLWTARRELKSGNFSEALALFEEAGTCDPRLATAFEGMGRAHLGLGERAEAELSYARSIEADPDYAIGHYNLGVSRSVAGRYEEALDSFREALRIQGERAPTLIAYGEAAAQAGRLPLALDAFQRAARSDPRSSAAQLLAGQLLGQLGRYEEALASLERCLELAPENEEARRALVLCKRLVADG